jgi:PAS domain-containing protein
VPASHRPSRRLRLLPNSIVARVYGLYAASLLLMVAAALGMFYRYQFDVELNNAQERADSLTSVIAPAVSDSALIGDYDTIRRTLERAVYRSDFASASFIDTVGGAVRAERTDEIPVRAPRILVRAIGDRLFDANLPITVGGRDYGVLRLEFSSERIAGGLWAQTRVALALAAVGVLLGVALIRIPLVRWLGQLSSLQAFEAALSDGRTRSALPSAQDAPSEFRETFEVLGRAAATVQTQRNQAAVTLGAIADAVFTLDAEGRVQLMNPAARQLVMPRDGDYPELDALGRPIADVLPELFWRQRGLQPWASRRSRLNARHALEEERVIDSTLSEIRGPDGRAEGYVLALHDVSEQHGLNQRLRAELLSREGALVELRAVLESLARPGEATPGGQDDLAAISRSAAISSPPSSRSARTGSSPSMAVGV